MSSNRAFLELLEQRNLFSLLGIAPELLLQDAFPEVNYSNLNNLVYTAPTEPGGTGSFGTIAVPTSITLTKGAAPIPIKSPRVLTLGLRTDANGNLVDGVAGNDLVVEGFIDFNNNNVVDPEDYSGVLLTGEVLQFGFNEGGANDTYDFRLLPTGGLLVGFFIGQDIGMTMTSLQSTFTGDFSVGFGAEVRGVIGGIEPLASLSGMVWTDINQDGLVDFAESAIPGVTINLTGNDDQGPVNRTTVTDQFGLYQFTLLRPGTYSISEVQPSGYADGIDALGTVNNIPRGTLGNDLFSGITLIKGEDGLNYNFGEAGTPVATGQTATIGFWQNKNGQALIKALNGSAQSTQLGNWLAATMPNLYGPLGANLAGKSNVEVAGFYLNLFKGNKSIAGPTKFDAQVMSVALATYATTQSLAGNTAAQYGFDVSEYGLGASTYNIGTSGAAFGVANNTTMTVLNILSATNAMSSGGNIYNLNVLLRTLANTVYSGINESGDIL